ERETRRSGSAARRRAPRAQAATTRGGSRTSRAAVRGSEPRGRPRGTARAAGRPSQSDSRARAVLYQRVYDRLAVQDRLGGVIGRPTHARLPRVVIALALHLTGLVITGERWRVVIAALGRRLRLRRTILVNLAGIFVRNATPTTGLGGDASRIALLRAEGV